MLASWHSDSHRHTFSACPFRKVTHFWLVCKSEIQAFMKVTHIGGGGENQGNGFQGKVEMNLMCYLKLGCRALPGKKVIG